ncbi:hypothetical protein J6590_074193 [Homalodisca vitripennis]|nr:hypothetical protein J6590_074193 [Homalodisca vitripennis]
MTRGITTEGLQMKNVGLPPQPPRYGINQLSSNWGEKTKNPVRTCPPIAKFGCPFIHGRTDRMGLTKDKIPHLEETLRLDAGTVALAGRGHSIFVSMLFGQTRRTSLLTALTGTLPKVVELASHGETGRAENSQKHSSFSERV